MKKWKFDINSPPEEVLQRLDPDTLSNRDFVYSTKNIETGIIKFKLRKRIKDFDKLFYYNLIVLNGEISNSLIENGSTIEIHFKEHLLNILLRIVILVLGLLAISTGLFTNSVLTIIGLTILAIGILLWVWLNYKFQINIQKYKLLIKDLLKINDE
jgi:hypothetical protein